ncbi:hypothetical protein CUS80_14495, partial [Enterococcus faecium]|uniref:hypothetical protein n=1 Tax=Enterococcus faecium TaxID=1352 RepID=UPI000D4347BD
NKINLMTVLIMVGSSFLPVANVFAAGECTQVNLNSSTKERANLENIKGFQELQNNVESDQANGLKEIKENEKDTTSSELISEESAQEDLTVTIDEYT